MLSMGQLLLALKLLVIDHKPATLTAVYNYYRCRYMPRQDDAFRNPRLVEELKSESLSRTPEARGRAGKITP